MKDKRSPKIRPHELAFDIDGVIADTFRVFVEMARKDHGIDIEYEAITEYDFRKVVDIDEAVSNGIIQKILDDPLGIGIKPIEGAKNVLSRLSKFGPVLFVTARNNRKAIMKWVQHGLGISNADAFRLEATGTHLEKLPILRENNIRYFVEDRLDTCYLLHEEDITPIVFDQPWNRKPHPFLTVTDWQDIYEAIEWNGAGSPDIIAAYD